MHDAPAGRLCPLVLRRSRSSVSVRLRPGSACTDWMSASPSPATTSAIERAGMELGEVDAKPFGERGVEIDDLALAAGGEETGRRMVEIVDGVLQFLEEPLWSSRSEVMSESCQM